MIVLVVLMNVKTLELRKYKIVVPENMSYKYLADSIFNLSLKMGCKVLAVYEIEMINKKCPIQCNWEKFVKEGGEIEYTEQ